MEAWLAALNMAMALVSGVFAAITLARPNQFKPAQLSRETDRFGAATYAARAIPLALGVAIAVWITPSGPATGLLLGVALLAQLGDAAIGVRYRQWGMAIAASLAAAVHAAGLLAVM